MSEDKEIKNKINNAEKILEICTKALKGEISLDNLNLINTIYEPLKSELKKGRYDEITVEVYSQSAEIIQKKVENLLQKIIGKKIKGNFEFFQTIKSLNDDRLAETINFYHKIPEFSVPLTENYFIKCYTDLVINRPERKKYNKTMQIVDYFPVETEVYLIEKELNELYKKIRSMNKNVIEFEELLTRKDWSEAGALLILLTYLANEEKIEIYQEDFPNGTIYIKVVNE